MDTSIQSRVLFPTLLKIVSNISLLLASCLVVSCSSSIPNSEVVVSVKDQKLGIYDDGKLVRKYAISTSKFGIGDQPGSYRTPLGKHEVIAKIGHGLPTGAVLKSRSWNGEVLKPNAPGRDPIVSRILWLRGMENSNRNAMNRFIYIHGTTEENRLGKPASYGCIRMGMKDVVDVFEEVSIGAKVVVTKDKLPRGRSVDEPKVEPVPDAELSAGQKPLETIAQKNKPEEALQEKSQKQEVAGTKTKSKPDTEQDKPVAGAKHKKASSKSEKITTSNHTLRYWAAFHG